MNPHGSTANQSAIHSRLGGREGLTYVVTGAVVNVANLAFHVLVSRQLGPDTYGAVSALLSIVSVISIPLVALQAAIVREVAARGGTRTSLRRLLIGTAIVCAGLTALLAALSPLVAGFLALGSALPVLILSLWFIPAIAGPVLGGTLIGRLRLVPVALATVGGAAVRLAGAAIFDALHMGVEGPVVATLAGVTTTLVALCVALLRDRANSGPARSGRARHPPAGQLRLSFSIWQTLVAVGGYSALVGVDTVLARHILPGKAAGQYAAAATVAHIALFLPAAATILAFPRFVASRDHQNTKRDLLLSAGIVGGVGLAVALVTAVVPHLVITVLFGAPFQGGAPELRVLGVEAAVLGVVGLFTYFHLSRHSLAALLPWAAVVAVAAKALLARPDPLSLALVMLYAALAVVIVMGAAAWLVVPTTSPVEEERPGWLAPGGIPPAAEIDLTLVLPYFNPGARLVPHAAEVLAVLRASKLSFEIVAVSDGTTDGSDRGLEQLGDELRVVRLEQNSGKGAALRAGFAEARGGYVGFIDGDGDIPASVLPNFIELVLQGQAQLLIGSKLHGDSTVEYPWIRRVYSVGYRLLVRALIGLDASDTQAGVKLVRRDVLVEVLPVLVERGFAFDLELLGVARRFGFDRIVELPVAIRERFTSSISGSVAWVMLLDTVALAWRLRIRHTYDHDRARRAGDASRSGGPLPGHTPTRI
jgi:O-antigen/teichoic acid export membrane protein